MPHLRVLDLSYTPLTSLPSSLSCLTNLRLLSLKGYHSLNIPDEVATHKRNLRYLDLSCPNIKSLPPSLFSDMSCLEELLLNGCTALADPYPLPSMEAMTNLQMLRLTGTQITKLPDLTFESMQRLRLLDLSSNHHLMSLPKSLFRARGLEELHLQDCKNLRDIEAIGGAKLRIFILSGNSCLTSLPESLSRAQGLEEIRLQDCLNLRDIKAIGGANLRIFFLSGNDCLTSLPELFSNAVNLEDIHLQDCTSLKEIKAVGGPKLKSFFLSGNGCLTSLPESLLKATSLEEIQLQNCWALKEVDAINSAKLRIISLSNIPCLTTLPEWLSKAPGLEKLHIKDCKALKEIKMSGSSSLRSFSLSGSPLIIQLTLRACQQLEIIDLHDLPYLEMLDLSTSGIKEFPADILMLPPLRRLELLGMKRLRSFPWNKIQRLPQEFFLDQCSCDGIGTLDDHGKSIKQHGYADHGKTYIHAGDSRLFRTLDSYAARQLIREENGLERFHICVSPCGSQVATSKLSQKGSGSSLYKDVSDLTTKFADAELPGHPCRLDKHVEITNVINRAPFELRSLLGYAESLFLHDNTFDARLSDLDYYSLKECQLMRCHNMRSIFEGRQSMSSSMKKLWVSDLRRLQVVSQSKSYFYQYSSLTWVHLEHCPRLEKVFPWEDYLWTLKMLTIKFCSTLKAVFYSTDDESKTYLPSLQTICLLDLPHLQHLHENRQVRLPAWKELKIRGCPSLHRLPLLGQDREEDTIATTSSSPHSHPHTSHGPVHVSGELGWWNNLEWDDGEHLYCKINHCFQFKPPPPIAEIKYGKKKRPLG